MKKKKPVTSHGYLARNPTFACLRKQYTKRVQINRVKRVNTEWARNGPLLPSGISTFSSSGSNRFENLSFLSSSGRRIEKQNRTELTTGDQIPSLSDSSDWFNSERRWGWRSAELTVDRSDWSSQFRNSDDIRGSA